jgi:trans-AT polyketide synthase/acyltransferase/oxidoreductase domain-containing protein
MRTFFLFAGQGSQFYGMGSRLYQDDEFFHKHLDEVGECILKTTGKDILPVMMDLSKRAEKFDDLSISSYAILAFEIAAAKMLMDYGVKPQVLIGCSLGEITAQVISGAISMEEAVSQIHLHESIFYDMRQEGCCMVTVGMQKDELDLTPFEGCDIISASFDRQFVVSGPAASIKKLSVKLTKDNVPFLELPVAFPFHTAGMDRYEKEYLKQMGERGPGERKPKYELFSCVDLKKVTTIDDKYRWSVLREKIKWLECAQKIAEDDNLYIDFSADGELAASLKHLYPDNKNVYRISTAFNSPVDVKKMVEEIKEKGVKALKAYVFPGQGSQEKGMGAELFDAFPELTRKADEILGYSIKQLCLEDPDGVLNNTRYTQPALFTVSALGYLKKMQDGEEKPDFVAGHSLGEYSALFAAGVLDFETGLKLVKKRGELMSLEEGGGMAAVVGLEREKVAEVLNRNDLDAIDIANLNTPNQIVISGKRKDIEAAEQFFTSEEGCMMYKVLNVSGAFHSRYMENARQEFTKELLKADFHKAEIPVIANVTALPYDEEKTALILSKQLISSVYWTDIIRFMMAQGVETYEEIGPGKVVTGMVRKITRMVKPLTDDEIDELKNKAEEVLKEDLPRKKEDDNKEEVTTEVLTEQRPADANCDTDFKLGSKSFRDTYNLRESYVIGSMGRGISGAEVLKSAARNGLLSIGGTDGLTQSQIRTLIQEAKVNDENSAVQGFHMSYAYSEKNESELINLYLEEKVKLLFVSGYSTVSKNLIKYKVKGLSKDADGNIRENNHIMASVSRTEVAESFMKPAPERIIDALLKDGEITDEQALLAKSVPVSRDICVEADGGGYTNRVSMFAAFPAIEAIAKKINKSNGYSEKIRVGVSGGIGSAKAAAAAFLMGADFIVTGSVNQCTVEASTSDTVKKMLSSLTIQDIGYVSAGDIYDPGRMIQVVKKGSLFKARADKLYRICQSGEGIKAIDQGTKEQLETRYFGKKIEEIIQEILLEDVGEHPQEQLVLLYKWYLKKAMEWAIEGNDDKQTDYCIMCGCSIGSFNEMVKGTELESWKNRTIESVSKKRMNDAVTEIRSFVNGRLN